MGAFVYMLECTDGSCYIGSIRAKEKALVAGEYSKLARLAKRRKRHGASFETQAAPAPRDEER